MNKIDEEIRNQEFIPVLIGLDIGTYSIVRSFHEEYNVKSIVIGPAKTWVVAQSKIIKLMLIDKLEKDIIIKSLIDLGKEYKNKKILFGCTEFIINVIIENKKELEKYYIIPTVNYETLNNIVCKHKFYEICDKLSINYPKTILVDKNNYKNVKIPYQYPIIAKASNAKLYNPIKFEGKKKIYKINSYAELIETLDKVYKSEYNDLFLIQEFVNGEDDCMRVLTLYCNKNSEVLFSALGHPLLEEKVPNAIGNFVAITSEDNDSILNDAKKFLKEVNYIGYANFDIKYDLIKKKYYFFEINVRLGRSNYYIPANGYNYTKVLVDEYIYNKKPQKEVKVLGNSLYKIVPMYILKKYVKDKNILKDINSLKKVDPAIYKKDLSIKRMFYYLLSQINQIKKYKKYYKD